MLGGLYPAPECDGVAQMRLGGGGSARRDEGAPEVDARIREPVDPIGRRELLDPRDRRLEDADGLVALADRVEHAGELGAVIGSPERVLAFRGRLCPHGTLHPRPRLGRAFEQQERHGDVAPGVGRTPMVLTQQRHVLVVGLAEHVHRFRELPLARQGDRQVIDGIIDFIQIHPYANIYPYTGDLDDMILDTVREWRTLYPGKPLFIGESGLDARKPVDPLRIPVETLTMSAHAPVAINQAIWAAAVSGAMTGRMLWFEDGYDQFHPALDDRCAYVQYASYAECADGDPATELTLDVEIDIRPLVSVNRFIWPRPRPFPVAILTTSTAAGEALDFDAGTVDGATVRFGAGTAVPLVYGPVDVDGDTDLDLVLWFRQIDAGFVCGDTSTSLTGATVDGRSIVGSDSVRIVGCPP